jgi:SAM-dependent methyltransferase
MIPSLAAGIPSIADYKQLLRSTGFAEVERYSDGFLAKHRSALAPYSRKWVSDPLHQWSRQWEYPFTLSRISAELGPIKPGEPARILDAGSGVTFLPFLLAETFPNATVSCCDWDSSLAPIFDAINAKAPSRVEFRTADLHELPYEPAEFDLVYCVSVLEHTDRYPAIVDEFHRVLRPCGRLVVTVDLSASPGDADGIHELLAALGKKFRDDDMDPLRHWASGDRLTTTYAAGLDRRLLPWRHPLLHRLACLLSGHGWVQWPPPMTVACMSMIRTG